MARENLNLEVHATPVHQAIIVQTAQQGFNVLRESIVLQANQPAIPVLPANINLPLENLLALNAAQEELI